MSGRPAEVTPIRPETPTEAPPRARRTRSAPLGPAPAWLSAPGKLLWRSLVPAIDEAFPELLGPLDKPSVALMVEHLAIAQAAAGEMRGPGNIPTTAVKDENHGGTKKAPSSQVMRDHGRAFLDLARDYGLTLGARARIDLERLVPVVPDSDDDDDLFGG